MDLWKAVALCTLSVIIIGCGTGNINSNSAYFKSPASAVDKITTMMEKKEWPTLAKYYDLADSPIERESLVSGDFFYTDKKPANAHPAGFWRYKHPFPPGFKFLGTRKLEKEGVIEVSVQVEIDQGGGMIQRGIQTFLMRKSENGYQIMPHKSPIL